MPSRDDDPMDRALGWVKMPPTDFLGHFDEAPCAPILHLHCGSEHLPTSEEELGREALKSLGLLKPLGDMNPSSIHA